MIERITDFLASLPAELYVFLISILPIIELRGAIPVGAALGLPFYLNYPLAVFGNLLPVPFILAFIPMILEFMGRFRLFRPIVDWLRKKARKYRGRIIKDEPQSNIEEASDENGEAVLQTTEALVLEQKQKNARKSRLTTAVFIALMLFVAIPLPGTGAWTGALVAALFDLPRRSSLLAIALGVLISGVIVCLISYGALGFLSFIL